MVQINVKKLTFNPLKMNKVTSTFLCILISLLLIGCTENGRQENTDQPNIIFIFIDDLGYGDLSSYGNTELETPNIDRLADEGIKFTHAYVPSPICSPARVGVTTGQYPGRWNINSFLASRERNDKREMADYLDPQAPSIARTMKDAGYKTAHYGKWHMGGGRDVDDAPRPQEYGFDQSLVSFEGLGDRLLRKDNHNLSNANAELGQGDIQWVEKWERTGIYIDSTLSFIERNQDQPFYIHFWPGDVHDPFIPKPEWREKFSEFDNNHYRRDFYATLWNLDRQIGRILNKLDQLSLSESTLVVLMSDNGPTDWPYYYEEYFWPPGDAGPFRGRKWSLYEGGIRVPFLARWPDKIPAEKVDSTTIINAIDLFPTVGNLADVALPVVDIDGKDMSASLLGTPQKRTDPLYWEYNSDDLAPGNPRFESPNLAVRDENWKLLINEDSTNIELYNLAKDHAETKNVKDEHPEIARNLIQKVLNWEESLPESPEKTN